MANKKIEPRLQPVMHQYLEDLVAIGAYGSSKSDVAKTLIEAGIRDALAKGIIGTRSTVSARPIRKGS